MRAIAAALIALVSLTAHADDLWTSINVRSDHYAKNGTVYNSDTLGLGAEWATTSVQSWLAGWYHNSNHNPSIYGGWAAQPIQYRDFKCGGAIGVVTGYPAADVLPMLALVGSYDGKQYGSNIVITPPLGQFAAGSISLQVKLRTDLLSR
jgi:hypothetical protein